MSKNIKKRIIQHWNKQVDKKYLSNETNGFCIGIDSFKALDTTRSFVKEFSLNEINFVKEFLQKIKGCYEEIKEKDFYTYMEKDESKMIKFFDSKFLCNRYIRNDTLKIKIL